MQIILPDEVQILEQNVISNDIQAISVSPDDLFRSLSFLKNSPEYSFDMLKTLSCSQKGNCFEIMYLLFSTTLKHYISIFVSLPMDNAHIQSVSSIYQSANWDEREIYDLFGIIFLNHPNLKRILMPETWIGHPLRKDYINNDDRLRWNCER